MLSYYICIHIALPRSTTGSRLAGLVRLERPNPLRPVRPGIMVFIRGIIPKWPYFRLVRYYYLPRYSWFSVTRTTGNNNNNICSPLMFRPGSARVDGGTSRNRRRLNETGGKGKDRMDRFHQFWLRVF